jgi:RimJ/RimL family protein N-acetyltransferase
MAEEWISKRQAMFDEGKSAQFLVIDKRNGFLIGGIGLTIFKDDENAELGSGSAHPAGIKATIRNPPWL